MRFKLSVLYGEKLLTDCINEHGIIFIFKIFIMNCFYCFLSFPEDPFNCLCFLNDMFWLNYSVLAFTLFFFYLFNLFKCENKRWLFFFYIHIYFIRIFSRKVYSDFSNFLHLKIYWTRSEILFTHLKNWLLALEKYLISINLIFFNAFSLFVLIKNVPINKRTSIVFFIIHLTQQKKRNVLSLFMFLQNSSFCLLYLFFFC